MKRLATQPPAFYLIFGIEMWERFGYYALSAMAVLFMIQAMHFPDTEASYLYARFIALVYLLPSIGGYVGDKILGTKRTILLGQCILLCGYILISIPAVTDYSFALPLSVIAIGAGYFKPNPSSLLSHVYEGTDYHRDSGFTLFYMAINIGSLLSMILTPVVSRHYGWHVGFALSVIGLLVTNILFCILYKTIRPYGSPADFLKISIQKTLGMVMATGVAILLCWYLLLHNLWMHILLGVSVVSFFGFFIYQTTRATPTERKGMILFLLLFLQAIVFFVLFFQTSMSINLFVLRNVSHSLAGIPIHPAQFQALNGFWIFVMSPLLASVYQRLYRIKKDPSLPMKFASGTFLIGIAFLVIPFASLFTHTSTISGGWIVLVYGLISLAELLVSALGLSLVARYIPQRLMGYTMGLWFLCLSLAGILAGHVAAMASIPAGMMNNPSLSMPIYQHVFLWSGLIAISIAAVFFMIVPLLNRLATHTDP